jgi:hypothetical protein
MVNYAAVIQIRFEHNIQFYKLTIKTHIFVIIFEQTLFEQASNLKIYH